MRIRIVAVGRLRRGPEFDLISDYLDRFNKTGRSMGLGPVDVVEVEDKKAPNKQAQGALLLKALNGQGPILAMDEFGVQKTSPQFATLLAGLRDQGNSTINFVIGGADGIAPEVLNQAHTKLSFGPMVWPHMLARTMLSEQLYRAATILSGGPYHRV